MNQLTIFKSLAFVALLLPFVPQSKAQNQAIAQKPSLVLSVTQEAEGVYVISAGTVSDFVLELFLLSGQRVFASKPVSSEQATTPECAGQPACRGAIPVHRHQQNPRWHDGEIFRQADPAIRSGGNGGLQCRSRQL